MCSVTPGLEFAKSRSTQWGTPLVFARTLRSGTALSAAHFSKIIRRIAAMRAGSVAGIVLFGVLKAFLDSEGAYVQKPDAWVAIGLV